VLRVYPPAGTGEDARFYLVTAPPASVPQLSAGFLNARSKAEPNLVGPALFETLRVGVRNITEPPPKEDSLQTIQS